MREHLASAPQNATYTSPNIQNQVIEVLGDHILQKILTKVKQAKYFSLIADEVTDCSNKEQLGVVLRYVDSDNCCIREDLMSFLECDNGNLGQVLAEMMLTFLRKHDLDPTKLRGQGYDGAGNYVWQNQRRCSTYNISISPCCLYTLCLPLSESGCGELT